MNIRNDEVMKEVQYCLDTSTSGALLEIIEHKWNFNIYSTTISALMYVPADTVLDFFLDNIEYCNYRIFYGNSCVIWNSDIVVRFRGDFTINRSFKRPKFEDDILISGRRAIVTDVTRKFYDTFDDVLREEHQYVSLAMKGNQGIEYATLPIKADQKFYPEMYPMLKPNANDFIEEFLQSSANVLILIGDAGTGKSALINQMILSAKKRTTVIYDKDVMTSDQVYTQFINNSLQDEGGLMILEDADIVLADRIVSQNETMSKLLNLSDGIVDTSKAKFVFSANIKNKDDIDHALIRPGRCFDIVEFSPLCRADAEIAAAAIGRELFTDKDSYTVAEIFNSKENRTEKKRKVGFV